MTVEIIHGDCMEYMRGLPDNAFELAIVDPPYGIERFKKGGSHLNKHGSHDAQWNNEKPGSEFFSELFRVSGRQIVWGANNFTLPPSEYFIIWHKPNMPEGMSFASCEYAWTNVKKPAKIFTQHSASESRIHPTQKPIKLYQWLLKNYANPGDRILDTHLGSGSSAIAAHYAGHDFVGIELDADYYAAAVARFDRETRQECLF